MTTEFRASTADKLLSGYEPQETRSSTNRRFELLLVRITIFLHLSLSA